MKLTDIERAKFIYMLKILKNQGDEDYDYDNMITALQKGFELHYKDVFDCLYDETLSEKECQEVLDILEMYRGITYSYNNLKASGKQGALTDDKVRFPGFDGNNEGKQMSYVHYFIEDLDRYTEIAELTHGYYNSHMPMLGKYRAMLKKWDEYNTTLPNRYDMNEQELVDLLNCY